MQSMSPLIHISSFCFVFFCATRRSRSCKRPSGLPCHVMVSFYAVIRNVLWLKKVNWNWTEQYMLARMNQNNSEPYSCTQGIVWKNIKERAFDANGQNTICHSVMHINRVIELWQNRSKSPRKLTQSRCCITGLILLSIFLRISDNSLDCWKKKNCISQTKSFNRSKASLLLYWSDEFRSPVDNHYRKQLHESTSWSHKKFKTPLHPIHSNG